MSRQGLFRGRRATAATEFAIGASFMLVAVTGVYDFGRAFWARIQVISAAHSGAAYAATNGFNSNGIAEAATSSASLAGLQAMPAPAQVCGCPNGNVGVTIVACGTSCPAGGDAGTYVQVSATASHSFYFPLPAAVNPIVITATALARIQ